MVSAVFYCFVEFDTSVICRVHLLHKGMLYFVNYSLWSDKVGYHVDHLLGCLPWLLN